MDGIKTEDNQNVTLSDDDRLNLVLSRLDHLDDYIHRIDQAVTRILAFVDDNAPHLERAKALIDPAAKLRGMIGRKKG